MLKSQRPRYDDSSSFTLYVIPFMPPPKWVSEGGFIFCFSASPTLKYRDLIPFLLWMTKYQIPRYVYSAHFMITYYPNLCFSHHKLSKGDMVTVSDYWRIDTDETQIFCIKCCHYKMLVTKQSPKTIQPTPYRLSLFVSLRTGIRQSGE